MISWIWQRDRFLPGDALHISDRGVRHGISLFETIAIRNGRARFLTEHLALLVESAQSLSWPVPPDFAESAASLLAAPETDCGVARVYLTSGAGDAGGPIGRCGGFLMLEPTGVPTDPRPPWLTIEPTPLVTLSAGLKTGNYWFHHAARTNALHSGFDDSLIVNQLDMLICATMANVFVVLNGKLLTPPLSTGARPGVVRAWALRNSDATERDIPKTDLKNATEIFLTNSVVGIRAVGSLDGRTLDVLGIAAALAAEYESSFEP